MSAPSHTRNLDSWAQFFCAFLRFATTAVQYLSDTDSTLPRQLKKDTSVKGLNIRDEGHLFPFSLLFCRHPAPFALFPHPEDNRGWVEAMMRPPGQRHVSFGSSGAGLVDLPQDCRCVLHVVAHKVDPEVGPACRPPPKPLHWTSNHSLCLQEGKPAVMVLLGVVGCV